VAGFKDTKKNVRVEVIPYPAGEVELRYYDDPEVDSYLGWKLPGYVAQELVNWWEKFRLNKAREYPINKKTKNCQIIMYTDKYIEIRETDELGRLKMGGWSLPRVVMEELVRWKTRLNSKL